MMLWRLGVGVGALALVVSGAGPGRAALAGTTATGIAQGRPARANRAQATSPIIADPGDATVGTAVTLDGRGSSGDGLSYGWDFGDGSPIAGGAVVQHIYATVDDVTLQLNVRDSTGAVVSTSRKLRVVPAIQSLTARPQLGQIVPASSFPADLSILAPGPTRLSVKVGGAYLKSDSFDYVNAPAGLLLELPDVRVYDEDDPDIQDQLLRQPGASIPLNNNVNVTVTYAVSSGASEGATYALSLMKPPAAPAAAIPAPSPTPGPIATATATVGTAVAAPSATPGPAAGGAAPVVTGAYAQATSSPRPAPTAGAAGPTPRPAPTASVQPAASPTPAVAPGPAAPATWAITYPTYLPIVGLPTNKDDVGDYYLKGDPQFHHVDDYDLRRFSIKIARAGGVFPNDPQRAADNIYRYVYGLLGIGDPGQLQTDQIIIARIESGDLIPGARSGTYICIAHAYFLSALTRTLGLPDRELTIGLGSGQYQDESGAWVMNYYQEGANEVWYAGAWHHYDTWLGTRDRTDYLDTYMTYTVWYSYSEETSPFTDIHGDAVGVAGHDFAIGKFAGSPGSPDEWRFLEVHTRTGIRVADPGPGAYAAAGLNAPGASRDTVVAGIDNSPAETIPAP